MEAEQKGAVREVGAVAVASPVDEWLARNCEPEGSYRDYLCQPFRLSGWIVATDGNGLVAVPDDGRTVPDAHTKAAGIVGYLTADYPPIATFPIDELRAWCGEVTAPCPYCHCAKCGHKHTDGCADCDGSGVAAAVHVIDHLGTIGNTEFNRRLMARMLQGAPDGPVTIARTDALNPEKPVVLVGAGWRGVIMPLRPGTVEQQRDLGAEIRELPTPLSTNSEADR